MKRELIVIDINGVCHVAEEIAAEQDNEQDCKEKKTVSIKWRCTNECKPGTESHVQAIVALKGAFDKPVQDVRHTLETCENM